ncbi:hypothetical protein GWI33_007350 [Rhynchophorus ferrugineus]|uniref:DDE-1 domain-containing protein n=1 Tax=Rhynchophorus ferrugineus TaxID=354439 RepID=A0A834IGC2_RHYFE|nr:hypothetical protein GWI33_007350 [Rhynchophorus ferrugineus]
MKETISVKEVASCCELDCHQSPVLTEKVGPVVEAREKKMDLKKAVKFYCVPKKRSEENIYSTDISPQKYDANIDERNSTRFNKKIVPIRIESSKPVRHKTHPTKISLVLLLLDENVTLISLPPYATHKTQPLDRTFMGPLKTYYSDKSRQWLISSNRIFETGPITVNEFKITDIYQMSRIVFTESDHMASSGETTLQSQATHVNILASQMFDGTVVLPEHVLQVPTPTNKKSNRSVQSSVYSEVEVYKEEAVGIVVGRGKQTFLELLTIKNLVLRIRNHLFLQQVRLSCHKVLPSLLSPYTKMFVAFSAPKITLAINGLNLGVSVNIVCCGHIQNIPIKFANLSHNNQQYKQTRNSVGMRPYWNGILDKSKNSFRPCINHGFTRSANLV